MTFTRPLILYRTFPYEVPITFVVCDLTLAEEYRKYWVKVCVFFPDDPKHKLYDMLLPKNAFKREYLKFPQKMRLEIGPNNILVEFTKKYNFQLHISEIAKFSK